MVRGPVPKRSEERRRRNSPGSDVAYVEGSEVQVPPLRPGIHPLAKRWYEALTESGQARFYEPSDWAAAQILAEAIAEFAVRPRASLLTVIMSGSANLLVTEGDRRRLRLELMRTPSDDVGATATAPGKPSRKPVAPKATANRKARLLKAVGDG